MSTELTASHMRRIESDEDPLRCQANNARGQCDWQRVQGSQYCKMHGGTSVLKAQAEESKRMYRLTRYAARHKEFTNDEKIKSLREEVALARIVLEEIVESCQDSASLVMNSPKIADMLTRIEKLVKSCHQLEASTGMLLDKTAALHLASMIVQIIGKYVEDGETLDKISGDIIEGMAKLHTEIKETK